MNNFTLPYYVGLYPIYDIMKPPEYYQDERRKVLIPSPCRTCHLWSAQPAWQREEAARFISQRESWWHTVWLDQDMTVNSDKCHRYVNFILYMKMRSGNNIKHHLEKPENTWVRKTSYFRVQKLASDYVTGVWKLTRHLSSAPDWWRHLELCPSWQRPGWPAPPSRGRTAQPGWSSPRRWQWQTLQIKFLQWFLVSRHQYKVHLKQSVVV